MITYEWLDGQNTQDHLSDGRLTDLSTIRIFNLQGLIRVREGHQIPEDDYPPAFNFTEPLLHNMRGCRMIMPGSGAQPVGNANYAWPNVGGLYEDKPGFCKSVPLDEVRKNNYVLMPGRCVSSEAEEDDGIPFDDKMKALTAKLAEQFVRDRELETLTHKNLKGSDYEF